jgi:hypothetical protein
VTGERQEKRSTFAASGRKQAKRAANKCKYYLCNYCAILFVQVFSDLFTIKSTKWTYKPGDVGIHMGGVTGSIPVPPNHNLSHIILFLLNFNFISEPLR